MSLDPLAPLVGCWHGRTRICYPGSDSIEMVQTEEVRWVGNRTMITIAGNSYSGESSAEPVFTALAVIFAGDDLQRDSQLHWHAFQDGHVLQTVTEVAHGRFRWSSPSASGTVDYRAEFDERSWREWGYLTMDGPQQQVFSMDLRRQVISAANFQG
jgi:hypothetical protein